MKNREKWRGFATIVLLGIFLLTSIGCKNPEGLDAESTANIYVSNECGVAIDVFMDGNFQFSVEFLYYEIIKDVTQGVHSVAANKKDTEDLVDSESVDVITSGDYWVTILSPASIKVTNEYGQNLDIYMNGDYQGELEDQDSQIFSNMPYGEHLFEAAKTIDNTFVESVIIEVIENKEYTWTIK